jgi:sodium transport system ATP-binding protein
MTAVEFVHVSKTFGRRTRVAALDRVSFTVADGAVVTLLGANGSGKTTILRLIAGTITPDAGAITVLDRRVPDEIDEVRPRIGVLPGGAASLYDRLTVREYLRYIGRLRLVPREEVETRIVSIGTALGVSAFLDRRCGGLSTGMRQRTVLAAAIIHRPELVLFDEPTTGLDIRVRADLTAMIHRLADEGTTLIVATHHPDEIRSIETDRIVLDESLVP